MFSHLSPPSYNMRDKQDPLYSFLPAHKEALLPGLPHWCSGKESACQYKKSRVRSLCSEDPLEEEMATKCSITAWKIAWIEEPGGLQSMGLQNWS